MKQIITILAFCMLPMFACAYNDWQQYDFRGAVKFCAIESYLTDLDDEEPERQSNLVARETNSFSKRGYLSSQMFKSFVGDQKNIFYRYELKIDSAGILKQWRYKNDTLSNLYAYDLNDSVVSMATIDGDKIPTYISYKYDKQGNLIHKYHYRNKEYYGQIDYTYVNNKLTEENQYCCGEKRLSYKKTITYKDGKMRTITEYEGEKQVLDAVTTYNYAATGELLKVEKADAQGQILSKTYYTYDENDRIKKEFYYDGDTDVAYETISYTYTANGRIKSKTTTTLTDNTIKTKSVEYEYDEHDNVTRKRTIEGNSLRITVYSYTYYK